jgi:hypothetical protein
MDILIILIITAAITVFLVRRYGRRRKATPAHDLQQLALPPHHHDAHKAMERVLVAAASADETGHSSVIFEVRPAAANADDQRGRAEVYVQLPGAAIAAAKTAWDDALLIDAPPEAPLSEAIAALTALRDDDGR